MALTLPRARPAVNRAARSMLRPSGAVLFRFVALIGVLITFACAYQLGQASGVFWSRTQVRLLAPPSGEFPNTLAITPSSLVRTAGIVAKIINPTSNPAGEVVNHSLTLADEGLRQGSSVILPNSGGQWSTVFSEPIVIIRAVGSSPQEVSSTVQRLTAQIDAALKQLQQNANVAEMNLIRTQATPVSPVVYYEHGSRIRATIGILLLGLSVTLATAIVVRRRLGRPSPPIRT